MTQNTARHECECSICRFVRAHEARDVDGMAEAFDAYLDYVSALEMRAAHAAEILREA